MTTQINPIDADGSSSLDEVTTSIQYKFKDLALLKKALVHRSYVNESVREEHNERLEFLGDAVLELIITEHLFRTYPNRPEGELTSFRSAVVRTESLAAASRELGLGEFIFMSKGEEATGGRNRDYILANTYEALLGAMYMDAGLKQCEKLVESTLLGKIPEIVEKRLDIDPKSKLQEISQEKYKYTPTYTVIKEEGPDHERIFTVQAIINEKGMGTGSGKSKQEAEQAAALTSLQMLADNML